MISEVLIPKLHERFSERGLCITKPPACAVFPAIHPAVGDIEIFDDGDELTVVAGNFTHSHFSNYDDKLSEEEKAERIADDVVKFLEEMFADQIVMWGSHLGCGGWHRRGRKSFWQKVIRQYVWSGPL